MSEKEPQQTEQEIEAEAEEQTAQAVTETVVTGSRVRRTIQKFGFTETKDDEEEEFKPPVGPGVKLSEMEAVAERISHMGKKDAETIKSLYSIMYNRRFQQKNIRTIKEHILEFSGVPDADDKVRQQLAGKMGRWMRNYVQDIMDVLGVDRSKKSFDEENKPFDKEALINRLVEWLCNPQESAAAKRSSATATKKKSPTAKTAKKAAKTAKPAATGTKRKTAAAAKKGPAKKTKMAAAKEEDDATESEVEEEEVEEDDNDDSDFDDEDGKKKTKKGKKTTKRAPKTKAAKEEGDDDEEETDESMEPEVDAKEEEPKESDLGEDVQAKVKDIIAKGDAEQLTVKKIVRQLSEDLGQDFSTKKAAIKDFVTNLQM